MFCQDDAPEPLAKELRMTNDLLSGVGDGPFPHAAISAALGREETQFEVVPGSELRQAGSLTALLRDARDPACTVFLKKVTAGLVANKAWNDRRRVLLYIRNELRFYEEFADGLRQRGVDVPPAYLLSSSNLDGLEEYEEEFEFMQGGAMPDEDEVKICALSVRSAFIGPDFLVLCGRFSSRRCRTSA